MNPPPVPPSPLAQLLVEGADLFNRQEFFEAHELWEEAWRESGGDDRRFFQGLIQCAVALEHARRGNMRGALRLFERYPAKFVGLPEVFMGVEVAEFLNQMDRALRTPGGFTPRIDLGFASKSPRPRID